MSDFSKRLGLAIKARRIEKNVPSIELLACLRSWVGSYWDLENGLQKITLEDFVSLSVALGYGHFEHPLINKGIRPSNLLRKKGS